MFDNLRVDLARARADRSALFANGRWKKSVWFQNLRILMALTTLSILSYRFSRWVSGIRLPVLRQLLLLVALIFQRWAQLWTATFISRDADIGPGLIIHSPFGICIGPARIGANCTVGSGVLIGGGAKDIGDNVYFGPGSKIVGDASIGNNVVIAANSLVLTDIPDNTTAVGVPARILLPGGRPRRFPPRARDGRKPA